MLSGDELYASQTSLVGSIGVINATFGAVEAMKRLGIERRVYTAGEYKDMLDPFRWPFCHILVLFTILILGLFGSPHAGLHGRTLSARCSRTYSQGRLKACLRAIRRLLKWSEGRLTVSKSLSERGSGRGLAGISGVSECWLHARRPVRPDEEARLKEVLEDVHDAFKAAVRELRGPKLDSGQTAPFHLLATVLCTTNLSSCLGAVSLQRCSGLLCRWRFAHCVAQLPDFFWHRQLRGAVVRPRVDWPAGAQAGPGRRCCLPAGQDAREGWRKCECNPPIFAPACTSLLSQVSVSSHVPPAAAISAPLRRAPIRTEAGSQTSYLTDDVDYGLVLKSETLQGSRKHTCGPIHDRAHIRWCLGRRSTLCCAASR